MFLLCHPWLTTTNLFYRAPVSCSSNFCHRLARYYWYKGSSQRINFVLALHACQLVVFASMSRPMVFMWCRFHFSSFIQLQSFFISTRFSCHRVSSCFFISIRVVWFLYFADKFLVVSTHHPSPNYDFRPSIDHFLNNLAKERDLENQKDMDSRNEKKKKESFFNSTLLDKETPGKTSIQKDITLY